MKIAWIVSPGVVLALLIGGPAALAEGWSLAGLNPFAKQAPAEVSSTRHYVRHVETSAQQKAPSPLQKLNAGTKKFFAGTWDTLRGRAPTAKKPAKKQAKKAAKPSWLQSMFRREEPKPVKSFDDWWALKRMDP